MKSYQILVSSDAGAGDVNDKVYKFDWSILPEGEYEMSFTFMSEPLKMTPTKLKVMASLIALTSWAS